jgi:type I restriction enzyme R subunit
LPRCAAACRTTRDDEEFFVGVARFAACQKHQFTLLVLVPYFRAVWTFLFKGILEAIDMDSHRVEKQAAMKIILPDDNAEIEPVPTTGGGRKAEPELDRLSNILKTFNDQFGTLFTDADRVVKRIRDDVVPKVAADKAYQNAKQNTPNTARIEHDKALAHVMWSLLKDDTEVYKQFVQNESFKRFVTDMVYALTNV